MIATDTMHIHEMGNSHALLGNFQREIFFMHFKGYICNNLCAKNKGYIYKSSKSVNLQNFLKLSDSLGAKQFRISANYFAIKL